MNKDFKYIKKGNEVNVVNLEIAYQLKRIADKMGQR